MSKISSSLNSIRLLDDMARQESFIHGLHPLMKLLTTVLFLVVVVSFNRYEVTGLLPLMIYPVMIFVLADIPLAPILTRVLLVQPLIIGLGIANPLLDQQSIILGGLTISRGWVSFLSLLIKSGLTVTAALLLISTTGMNNIAMALRILRIPRLFVLQLLLTYRYISLLMEETARLLQAYFLRALKHRSIHPKVWGSLAGQLLIRSFERGQRIYQAMRLRGFQGEYIVGARTGIKASDISYLMGWVLFFLTVRFINISVLMGSLILGVVR